MAQDPEHFYVQSEDVQESRVGDRVVLYHRTLRKALVLNPTGSLLWHSLATPQTLSRLAEDLKNKFPDAAGPQAEAEAEVKAFIESLLEHEMLLKRT